MEVKEENILNKLLCYACLCVGRCLYKITNQDLVRYYLDALDEIPLSKTKQLVNITVCWECKAILQKCWSFREQAKDCYRILLTYTNENLNECLFSDVSRPSHLQIQQMDSINITSEQSQDHHTSPIHVKEENLKDNEIKDSNSINGVKGGSISDSFVDDCLSDGIDNEDEQVKAELETIMFCNEREDKESGRSKAKRVKKIVKRIKRKKNLNECLFSDVSRPSHLQIQQMDSINITSEHSQDHHPSRIHVKQEEIKDNEIKDSNSINGVKGGSISDSFVDECLSDGIDNEDEQVKAELETIMFCNNREDKEGVRSKAKRAKKIVKRINVKKPKRKKINQKVVVIELSYEEMLEERESESKRDSYVKAEFKCDTCLLGFHYKKTYQAHMKSKHSTALGAYICPICKTIISSVDSFTAHYKRHMRRYECVICHKRTTDLKVMEHHYYSTHEISLKQYTCNICGKLSNSVDTHRYHKDTHKARIQCPDCDKSFRHRAGLMNHRLAVHECQNVFPCAVCNKVFRWKTSLKRHLQKHEPKNKPSVPAEPFCTTCNISFSSVCSYQRHMKNSLKHVTQDQLKFICDHCNRRFSDKTKLRDHIEEKHLHKTYQCHICSKPSKNRVGLDQHIRNVHMGRPKNKMCHYCGRGFPTKMQLESHIRTHTGERPFICEFCPTTFSQQSNLYKHNRQVHLNIKTKRYPIVKKRKEDDQNQIPKVPALTNQTELEEPYRAIVLQYSPEREFVL